VDGFVGDTVALPVSFAVAFCSACQSMRDRAFNQEDCGMNRHEFVSLFSDDQQLAIDAVVDAVEGRSPTKVFTVFSSAGSGKAVFVNGLTSLLRARGCIVINVAASALAATLLPTGSTAHSTFRIPIPTTNSSCCGVKSADRELMRQCKCFFYDEVSMVGKEVADSIDIFLKDLMESSLPFGGKVMVFLADFKHLLPIKRGSTNIVQRGRPKKQLACMTARKRRDSSPDMHLCELLTLLNLLHLSAVRSYSWHIRHRQRQNPQIRIVMLVDSVKTVAVVTAALANAFEDIDDMAFMVTVDADAYFEMVTVD
jgi:hypothetical protein